MNRLDGFLPNNIKKLSIIARFTTFVIGVFDLFSYKISQSAYEKLAAVSFDELRQQKLFTADLDTVALIETVNAVILGA